MPVLQPGTKAINTILTEEQHSLLYFYSRALGTSSQEFTVRALEAAFAATNRAFPEIASEWRVWHASRGFRQNQRKRKRKR